MHRIDSDTAVAVIPASDPLGAPGYFTKGNPGPGTPVPATNFTHDWCNSIQEEIAQVVESAGIALDKTKNNQLLAALKGPLARIRLTANTTFFVATTGNDVTGDGTVGNPYRTSSKVVSLLQSNYDLNSKTVTVFRQAGAYNDPVAVNGPLVGQSGAAQLVFDGVGATAVVTCAGPCYLANTGGAFTLKNQKLVETTNFTVLASNGSSITLGAGLEFGTAPSGGSHINATSGGFMQITANYAISGGAGAHFSVDGASNISIVGGITATLTGTPAFTAAFALAQRGGVITDVSPGSITFVGGATGPRYSIVTNGVIDTAGGGASHYPGNAAGATATGGQYV